MRRVRTMFLTAVCVVLVVSWNVPELVAAPKAKKPEKAPTLCAGKVVGTVIDADSKTPVKNASVKVYDHKGKKLLFSTTTDKKGKYSLKALKPGIYRLIVADRVMTEVTVMTDGEIVELDFRIPHVYLAPLDEGKDAKTKGTKAARAATVRFALVTVGVGAAIAVPLALVGGKTVKKYYVASPDS